MAAEAAQVNFTVFDALVSIGIDNHIQFNGATKAQRIATEMFDDDFETCLDKTFKEIDEDLKSWGQELTINNGQIRLTPIQKKNIKAMTQWAKNKIRQGQDPTAEPFLLANATELIKNYKSHEAFITKASTLADAAKPDKFTDTTRWKDWKPTFVNYLRHIPGRYGVPIVYVIRDYCQISYDENDILGLYVQNAPHEGEAFQTDSAEIHTYLANFIKGNVAAEAKITSHGHDNNGLEDMKSLTEHYEGVGIHSTEISTAEKGIDLLFYNGEKRPHMWWAHFELRLVSAFAMLVEFGIDKGKPMLIT